MRSELRAIISQTIGEEMAERILRERILRERIDRRLIDPAEIKVIVFKCGRKIVFAN